MLNMPLCPFEATQNAAETLTDLRIKSQLLSELARSRMSVGQFDTALKTFAAIPLPQERRIALLTADFQFFPSEKVESLIRLLNNDPKTNHLAGSLALSMLEAQTVPSAWQLIETAKEAFETEQQRYDFLEKLLTRTEKNDWEKVLRSHRMSKILTPINEDDWTKVLRFHQTFTDELYRDWATLAIVKYLGFQQRYNEVEGFVNTLSSSIRRSWAYWEICRLSPAEQSKTYFDKSVEIVEAVAMTPDNEEEMETLAIQLRILGRAAIQRGKPEQGEQLLEKSESAIDCLAVPMQRYRLRCFLGKVLLELRLIASIQEYVAIDEMLQSLPSGMDRSRVLVWLAETGWSEGWTKAVETMAIQERGVTETGRAGLITYILKRFVAHHQDLKASGDPSEDSVRMSGEEFETFYFSPFVKAECGC